VTVGLRPLHKFREANSDEYVCYRKRNPNAAALVLNHPSTLAQAISLATEPLQTLLRDLSSEPEDNDSRIQYFQAESLVANLEHGIAVLKARYHKDKPHFHHTAK
jgi:hypothetical protein